MNGQRRIFLLAVFFLCEKTFFLLRVGFSCTLHSGIHKYLSMKNTKIVATIGPASEDKETLRRMIEAGMNVARLNFSHGEYAWFAMVITRLRELSEELRVPIALLADLQGPRIRVEVDREIILKKGERVHVADVSHRETFARSRSKQPICYLDVPKMASKLSVGDMILIGLPDTPPFLHTNQQL